MKSKLCICTQWDHTWELKCVLSMRCPGFLKCVCISNMKYFQVDTSTVYMRCDDRYKCIKVRVSGNFTFMIFVMPQKITVVRNFPYIGMLSLN